MKRFVVPTIPNFGNCCGDVPPQMFRFVFPRSAQDCGPKNLPIIAGDGSVYSDVLSNVGRKTRCFYCHSIFVDKVSAKFFSKYIRNIL